MQDYLKLPQYETLKNQIIKLVKPDYIAVSLMFYQVVMQIRTSDDITSSSFMGNARQLFKNTKSYNNSIKISFEIRYNLKGCFRFTSKFLKTNFILNILFRSKSTLPAMGLLHFERKGTSSTF